MRRTLLTSCTAALFLAVGCGGLDEDSEDRSAFGNKTGYPCDKTRDELVALAKDNVVKIQFDPSTGEPKNPISGSVNASVTEEAKAVGWFKSATCHGLSALTAYQVENTSDMNVGLRAYAIEEEANARILLFEDVGGEWQYRKEVTKATKPATLGYKVPRDIVLKQTMAAGSKYYLIVISRDVNKADITFTLRVGKVPLISTDGSNFCPSLAVPDKFFLAETTSRVFKDSYGFFDAEPFVKWPTFVLRDASNRVLGYVHKDFNFFQELLNSPVVFDKRTICMSNAWGEPYLCTGENPSWGARTVAVAGCDGMTIGRLQESQITGGEENRYDVFDANGQMVGVSAKYNATSRFYKYAGTSNPLTTFLWTNKDIGPDAAEDPSKWLGMAYRTQNKGNDAWAYDFSFSAKAATKIDPRLLITAPASKTAADNEDQIENCTEDLSYGKSASDCDRCCKKESAFGGQPVPFKKTETVSKTCYECPVKDSSGNVTHYKDCSWLDDGARAYDCSYNVTVDYFRCICD